MKSGILKRDFKPERDALGNAIDRCSRTSHPQFGDYGGRGITVAPEFCHPQTGLLAFLEEVGPRPRPDMSLDRIDNDLGYHPGNIRWASRAEQNSNRRTSRRPEQDLGWGFGHYSIRLRGERVRRIRSALIRRGEETRTIGEWSKLTGLPSVTIRQRIQRGWSAEQALDPILRNPRNSPRARQLPGRRDNGGR